MIGDGPLVEWALAAGPDDPVFGWLMLGGPVVVGLVAVLGRSVLTVGIAGGYLVVLAAYVLYNGVRGGR